MTALQTHTWLDDWRQRMQDQVPLDHDRLVWLWILGARAEADPSLARRMAIVDVLLDGRPHLRDELRQAVEERLGEGCSGTQPEQTLWADMRALRAWGVCIGYSRKPGSSGYFLAYPSVGLARETTYQEAPHELQIEAYRTWDSARKMYAMFEMFEFAMRLAQTGARARHPDTSQEEIEVEARELVTGQPRSSRADQ